MINMKYAKYFLNFWKVVLVFENSTSGRHVHVHPYHHHHHHHHHHVWQARTSGSSSPPCAASPRRGSPTWRSSSSSSALSSPSSTGLAVVAMPRLVFNITIVIVIITMQVPLSLFYALALYVIAPFAHWVHLSHGAQQYYVTTSVSKY